MARPVNDYIRSTTREQRISHCRSIWRAKEDAKRERIRLHEEFVSCLTPAQRLARLNDRLGYNVGAKRERARLAEMMA